MEYDQITRDLAHKAGQDACDAIHRTMALAADNDSRTMIALMAAGESFAIPAAMLALKLGAPVETVVDVLIERIRPIIIDGLKRIPPETRYA